MNPSNQISFGSGNNLVGANSALQALVARSKGSSSNPLDQVSASSPSTASAVPMSTPPQGSPAVVPQAPQNQPSATGMGVSSPESHLIVKALSTRLKDLGNIQKMGLPTT